ncbi:hypothetical protein [Polyangium sp. 15x6]|uniref:hypothetical protein n=1 Tax=Polyangium sp. 15x6 TaxID=3042687 RepID=UPI00249A61F9|nr:hypothetical protein [Polyangium sp. 15x6]MDI3288787.1 hypothetical protein [Polyangium sp. 15x6]
MSAQRIPKWFRAVAGATAVLWIIVSIYYWLGAGGIIERVLAAQARAIRTAVVVIWPNEEVIR